MRNLASIADRCYLFNMDSVDFNIQDDLSRWETQGLEHIRHHGRYYRGLMKKLFADSVRAAYTLREIRAAVDSS